MTVEQEAWGEIDGQAVHRYRVSNGSGVSMVLSDYGATLTELHVPAPDGQVADIVLGYDTLAEYQANRGYFGASVGRFGNRIRGGTFALDGQAFQVAQNEGETSLHGGHAGFDKKVWDASYDATGGRVAFGLVSPDHDEGFPGTLEASATYSLGEDGTVRIAYHANCDRATVCNIVNHSYFNLAGHDSGPMVEQQIQIEADFYTPVDEDTIPTGEVLAVAGTEYDFREPRQIGTEIADVPIFGGFDHNWCLRGEPGHLRHVVMARDPASGRGFTLATTEPGVQFYTANHLRDGLTGKGGASYPQFAGFTLETQRFPNGPNVSHFPQARLDPHQEYRHVMEFRFLSA